MRIFAAILVLAVAGTGTAAVWSGSGASHLPQGKLGQLHCGWVGTNVVISGDVSNGASRRGLFEVRPTFALAGLGARGQGLVWTVQVPPGTTRHWAVAKGYFRPSVVGAPITHCGAVLRPVSPSHLQGDD